MSHNDAYVNAIERAKQVVSKFSTPDDGHSNGSYVGGKRPSDSMNQYPNAEKRPYTDKAAAAAHEAAARLSQKLAGGGAQPPQQNSARQITSETSIPDRFVGLVIGKKGEQITALQNDSNCKVQISQEGGRPERVVTLTGTPQQVAHAKQLLNEIIERAEKSGMGGPSSPPSYQQMPNPTVYAPSGPVTTVEVMIPGSKAGLVIGKNGETIKQLQEENGVKMVLIQQSSAPTVEDKPLRITGDPARIEKVKALVYEIITRGRMGNFSENAEVTRYAVPAEKAGLVIGKGGESIKEICRVSGAHVEISKEPPPDPSIKIFNIRGNRNEIEQAIRMISERAGIPISRPTSGPTTNVWGQLGYSQPDSWTSNMPAPTLNPYTGQPDYSAAWIEYYRRQGMHEYADMIQRQAQQQHQQYQQSAVGSSQAGGAQSGVAPVSHPNQSCQQTGGHPNAQQGGQQPVGYGGDAGQQGDYNQWQQWQQWQAWQAWQQHGGGPGGIPPPQPPQGGPAPSGGPQPPHH
uniref:KH domain-containing protein n=3 Tax=Mesocestoides corti TaxID=53468 RepID=A0A5K3EKV9_MESCO